MTAKENDKLDRLFEATTRIDERTLTLVEKQEKDDKRWEGYGPVLKVLPETIKMVGAHESIIQKGKGILWLVTVGVGIIGALVAWFKGIF